MSWVDGPNLRGDLGVEHLIAWSYGWTPATIDETTADDVLSHWMLIRQRTAINQQWACTAGGYAWMEQSSRERIHATLKAETEAGCVRKTEFEIVPADTRVLMIGEALVVHGERWGQKHPQHLRWLKYQGLTTDDAIQRHQAWSVAQQADEFWDR